MKTSFGFFNNNTYEIDDWHQLLNIESEFKDIALSINCIDDHICEGTSISIYNKISKINYVTFFVTYSDNNIVPVSNVVVPVNTAIAILNAFGFKVNFVEMKILKAQPLYMNLNNTINIRIYYRRLD